MGDARRPIRSLEDARRLFLRMGCSHFHMSRDNEVTFAQYRALQIDAAVERQWRYEALELECAALENGTAGVLENAAPWATHAQIVELAEMLREERAVVIACEVTERLPARLEGLDRVIVAESVLGQSLPEARTGLACCAFDIGRPDLAERVLRVVEELLAVRPHRAHRERFAEAGEKCVAIRKVLGLAR